MDEFRPVARTAGILTEEVDGELLVYDQRQDDAHRLNATAAVIWRHLDGELTVAQLVDVVADEVGDVADEDLVLMTLDQLSDAGLLEDHEARTLAERRESRRRFIRRVGVVGSVALALPVVRSIVAPTPAAAQSPCTCACGACECSCSTCTTCTTCTTS